MRNVERIDPIIDELRNIWKANPDWRFGQLVSNVFGEIMHKNNVRDMFFPEDKFWLEELKKYAESHSIYNYGQDLLKEKKNED